MSNEYKPFFSFLIPIIKGRFLDFSIKSVLSQTDKDFELILYNDNSDDDIDTIVSKYNDNRIIYKRGVKNIGMKDPSIVWNLMLNFASGDYFCLLGDDDIIAENYLSEFKKIILNNKEVSLFRTKLKRIDENNSIFYEGLDLPEYETWINFLYERLINNRVQSTCEFVIKKKSFLEIGGYVNFPRACGSDDATHLSLSREKGIVSTNKTFAHWRRSKLNISDNDSEEVNNKKAIKYLEWEKKFVKENNIEKNFLNMIETSLNNKIRFYKIKDKIFILNNIRNKLKYFFR